MYIFKSVRILAYFFALNINTIFSPQRGQAQGPFPKYASVAIACVLSWLTMRFTDSVVCALTFVQGAYVGITTGLILTLWVGIGAQVYKPAVLGYVPPPMNTTECPYRNVSVNNTQLFTTTTYQTELSSNDSFALVAGAEDM